MDKSEVQKRLMNMGYKESSAKTLVAAANAFLKKHYKTFRIDRRFKNIIQLLEAIPNLNTRKQSTKAMWLVSKTTKNDAQTKRLFELYKKLLKESSEKRMTDERKKIPTDAFDTKKEQIMKSFNAIEKTNTPALIMKLPEVILMKMLDELPARRSMDYRILQMKKPKTNANESNYISRGKIYYNKFKTSMTNFVDTDATTKPDKVKRKAKGVVVALPKDIKDLINKLKKLDKGRVYLLEAPGTREPLKESTFSKMIKKEFGMTINDFRKRWVQKNVNSPEVKKSMKVAEDMSNSVRTQQTDYAERD